jgi:hypothetical protein
MSPLMFVSFAVLLLVEVGWYLYREARENLEFVAKENTEPEHAEGDVPKIWHR